MEKRKMTESGWAFLMGPGIETGNAVLDKMLRAHEAEVADFAAEFYNYGWFQCSSVIESKTSRGILATEIDPKTMKVTHHWGQYPDLDQIDPAGRTVRERYKAATSSS
jgi:hypothetical protein